MKIRRGGGAGAVEEAPGGPSKGTRGRRDRSGGPCACGEPVLGAGGSFGAEKGGGFHANSLVGAGRVGALRRGVGQSAVADSPRLTRGLIAGHGEFPPVGVLEEALVVRRKQRGVDRGRHNCYTPTAATIGGSDVDRVPRVSVSAAVMASW